ncbi:MAG: hypothetical protein H6Q04_781 [Acidobacteria bacterium]|nr:hypothetical protein [Acidobacteriota bacterium]
MKSISCAFFVLLALTGAGCQIETLQAPEMAVISQLQPLNKEKTLNADINVNIGSVEVSGSEDPASLYSLDLDYDKANSQPDINYSSAAGGEEGRLSFALRDSAKTGARTARQDTKLRINFSNLIPLDMKLITGVGESRLNLSGGRLARLDFTSGVGSTKISSYDPNQVACEHLHIKNGVGELDAVGLGNLNFSSLEYQGGVGAANLDFTGEWKQDADIKIEVGVGAVRLKMPRNIGVRVEAPKSFLSGLHLDGFDKVDNLYYSDNYDAAKIRIFIRIATGIGECRISWV